MIPEKLDEMIKLSLSNKEAPFFVVCTGGSKVLGAFDPIEPIDEICQKYKLWLHVDV